MDCYRLRLYLAWVIHGAGKLLLKLKIDDPLEAAPMHGACGAFGVFWVGLMARKNTSPKSTAAPRSARVSFMAATAVCSAPKSSASSAFSSGSAVCSVSSSWR